MQMTITLNDGNISDFVEYRMRVSTRLDEYREEYDRAMQAEGKKFWLLRSNFPGWVEGGKVGDWSYHLKMLDRAIQAQADLKEFTLSFDLGYMI